MEIVLRLPFWLTVALGVGAIALNVIAWAAVL